MPINKQVPLKYLPSQLQAISKQVQLQPDETIEDVRDAFDLQMLGLKSFARANHFWRDRTSRATDKFNVFTDDGRVLGVPRLKNKFFVVMAHGAVDPRNNEAYGWYLENKIYSGAPKPYGVLPQLMKYATTTGMRAVWGRLT
jgi:hypothetical protein